MPDALPLTGLYGKVPAHGDFVRRNLPTSFVGPWDAWLQAGIARAREGMGGHWPAAWDAAPAWRFALPAGACGPDAVAGVMLPSEDQVGRRFPITLAVLLAPGDATPAAAWFDVVEAAAWAGRTGRIDADALAAALPLPGAPLPDIGCFLPAPVAPPAAAGAEPGLPAETPAAPAPSDPPGEPDDVLALLGGQAPDTPFVTGETPAEAPTLPGDSTAPDTDGTLAMLLGGGAQAAPEAEDRPSDVLALLGGQAPDTPFVTEDTPAGAPALPGDSTAPDTDGTLAMLIGAAEVETSAPSDPPDAGEAPDGDDPLPGLIDAGTKAAAAPPDDMLPAASAALPWPDVAEASNEPPPPPFTPPAEAPPPPEGGGWWTRGGLHVPPMVWPLAALPPAEDFAYLLEAEA